MMAVAPTVAANTPDVLASGSFVSALSNMLWRRLGGGGGRASAVLEAKAIFVVVVLVDGSCV